MAIITAQDAGGQNVVAYLDMLGWSEIGTAGLAASDDGYNVVVTGIDGKLELFSSYADHPFANGRPSKVINSKGLTSNAAGRYQQMLKDWPHYRDLLQLPDFGPLSQDRLAIQHIKECRALPDVIAGNIASAIAKCSNIWASLPGNSYGQPVRPTDDLIAHYLAASGVMQ
ncbi:glycoside hydrolase family 104 protein [Pseudomonas sp. 681]|jgi:muramidase (phage lysozyme)|uniref:Glycoside hydrolase family 104 protein n=1 Tax=Pseudomonas fungipugnans TaxID=3024217 RepID=A0ABT6QXU7_9PSED|nr:glycoside hydrolase family 104 protein [Pseudomonas sp. 681]MDI2595037.1 glycoside hydrolase family 104 protein [Pseudomonas sp. 681]